MIEVKKLSFSYGTREVLRSISFTAHDGEVLSVLGPNAVGKSTLFGCLLRLLRPSSGSICIDGESVAHMTPKELARRIAYIPQSHNPVFNYSVFDIALMGTTAQLGAFANPSSAQEKAVEAALERLGISHLAHRGYARLSGGERQLALIARALVQDARILVMDEPSSGLDYGNRLRVMRTIRALATEGYCVIQSTHDPDQAYLYSDRILALFGGEVLAHGRPSEIFDASLISKLYGVEVEVCDIQNGAAKVCVPKGAFS